MASANCKLMWHEARQQEKFVQKMLVDYSKRAERRKEYYEKIKLEPTQFLQVHGRGIRIHMDPAIYTAAEAPGTMLPWRGDNNCLIDRFDVRAHLDEIPDPPPSSDDESEPSISSIPWDDRQANYERYRTLVQNTFMEIPEEKFLQQVRQEELYGPLGNKSIEEEKKALAPKKAAIGFTYDEDSTPLPSSIPLPPTTAGGGKTSKGAPVVPDEDKDSDEDSDSDIDLDMTVDVMQLDNLQQQLLNTAGIGYGLKPQDFMDLISRDLQEAEELRQVKQHQDEKALLSGRKSRKERRALKKKTIDKKPSPPSYAARSSPSYDVYRKGRSSSRSPSPSPPPPPASGKIKFITSFGGDSDGGSDREDGVTGVIILPKQRTDGTGNGSSSSSKSRRRDRKKNRWDQTSAETSKESPGSSCRSRTTGDDRHHPRAGGEWGISRDYNHGKAPPRHRNDYHRGADQHYTGRADQGQGYPLPRDRDHHYRGDKDEAGAFYNYHHQRDVHERENFPRNRDGYPLRERERYSRERDGYSSRDKDAHRGGSGHREDSFSRQQFKGTPRTGDYFAATASGSRSVF